MTPNQRDPLRVAMLVPSLRGGGLERVVRDLAMGLDSSRFEVRVFAVGGLGIFAADLSAAGIPALDCTEPRRRIRGLPLRLIRELRRFRPEVVHAHSGTWYPASVAKVLLRLPVLIYTEHGRYPPEPWARSVVERWCVRRTDGLYAVSSVTADYIKDFLGIDRQPGILPNGVDLSLYSPAPQADRDRRRAEWGVGPQDLVVISVGRFVPVKNQAGIVRAAAKLGGSHLHLVFVGTGELEADVQALAYTLGVHTTTHFLGFREDVAGCLGAADAFVNASTTEGQPVSILEAMAVGLPVIATSVGGVPEVLGSPPAGVLIPSGDEDALAAALDKMAQNPSLRRDLSLVARERADAHSLGTFLTRHSDLYLRLAARAVHGRG